MKIHFGLALFFPGALLLSSNAAAHAIHIFAAFEGEVVEGRVYFEGDEPAAGLTVNVFSPEGDPRGVSETDAEGRFTYSPERMEPLKFVVETIEGHRASLTIDLARNEVYEEVEIERHEALPDEIIELLERAVAREVRPVLEELDRLENRIRFRDVIGGIGYIVGAMGLAALWKARAGKGGA